MTTSEAQEIPTLTLSDGVETRQFGIVHDTVHENRKYQAIVPLEQVVNLARKIEAGARSFADLPEIDLIWVASREGRLWLVTEPNTLALLDSHAAASVFA